MVKTRSNGRISYSCGSYKRYGGSVCMAHYIRHDVLERIILEDLNKVIASLENLKALEIQIERIEQARQKGELLEQPWVKELLSRGELSSLDRETVAETISQIRIFEDRHIEISYTFSRKYEVLLNPPEEREQ